MPRTNGHTVIEMTSHPRSRESSPRRAGHEHPTVHSSNLHNNHHVRRVSPSGDRRNNHHNGDNHHHHPTTLHNTHNTNTLHVNDHRDIVPPVIIVPHDEDKHNEANDSSTPHVRNRRDAEHKDDSHDQAQPLLETDASHPKPPLAGPEIDDSDEHDTIPASPSDHPGVDDGFFPEGSDDDPKIEGRFGEDGEGHDAPDKGVPGIKSDDDSLSGDEKGDDETDGVYLVGNHLAVSQPLLHRSHSSLGGARFNPDAPFPYAPEYRPGVEVRITPDVNVYQQKKNLAQGMMDLALFSANANQLRYVLEAGSLHPYFYPSLIFISASLILQIAVGVGLIINSRYNVKEHEDICKADKINDFTVIGIFLITIVNVFIASFGVATSPNVQPRTIEPS